MYKGWYNIVSFSSQNTSTILSIVFFVIKEFYSFIRGLEYMLSSSNFIKISNYHSMINCETKQRTLR